MVKTLAAGVDMSIRSTRSFPALDCAAKEGRGVVLGAIVGHEVDVNAREGGVTTLDGAARCDHADAVDVLIIKAGADIELKQFTEFTPLAYAAYFNSSKLCLRHCSTDRRLTFHKTMDILHKAACWGRREGVAASVDVLLR